jgi:hypothetical protein
LAAGAAGAATGAAAGAAAAAPAPTSDTWLVPGRLYQNATTDKISETVQQDLHPILYLSLFFIALMWLYQRDAWGNFLLSGAEVNALKTTESDADACELNLGGQQNGRKNNNNKKKETIPINIAAGRDELVELLHTLLGRGVGQLDLVGHCFKGEATFERTVLELGVS